MTNVKLTEQAYANSGSIKVGVFELTEWYEAHAEDEEGNDYRVIWNITEGYNPYEQEEDCACDWGNPWAVLDDHYNDVLDFVEVD